MEPYEGTIARPKRAVLNLQDEGSGLAPVASPRNLYEFSHSLGYQPADLRPPGRRHVRNARESVGFCCAAAKEVQGQ